MNIELINKLYELINKSDNIISEYYDLFKEFYDDRFLYLNNISSNSKIHVILEYMVKNSKNLFSEYEVSDLIDLFSSYMGRKLEVLPFLKDSEKNEKTAKEIFELFNYYCDLKYILSNKDYYNQLSNLNKTSVDNFLSIKKIRDFSSAFIMILNYGYFNLDEKMIEDIILFIRNNNYVDNLNGKLDNLDINYIYQYLTKFVFIKDFSTKEELVNDKMIVAIVNGKIKYKNMYIELVNNVDIDVIMQIINNDLNIFLNTINTSYVNTSDKDLIIYKLLDKLLMNNPILLLEYYTKNNNNNNIICIFCNNNIDKLVSSINSGFIYKLSEESICYLLENYKVDISFFINLYEYYKIHTPSDKVRKILEKNRSILESICIYENGEEIELIRSVLVENKTISYIELVNICNTLISKLTDNRVKINYFVEFESRLGYYDSSSKIIGIRTKSFNYDDCTSKDEINKRLLDLLITIFHECTHYNQFKMLDKKEISEEEKYYLKEKIIREYYPNYYDKNYSKISYEKDARIKSFEDVYDYLEKFIPEACEIFKQIYLKEYEEDKNININVKEMFSIDKKIDIDRIFNRLIYFHQDILQNYPSLEDKKSLT